MRAAASAAGALANPPRPTTAETRLRRQEGPSLSICAGKLQRKSYRRDAEAARTAWTWHCEIVEAGSANMRSIKGTAGPEERDPCHRCGRDKLLGHGQPREEVTAGYTADKHEMW